MGKDKNWKMNSYMFGAGGYGGVDFFIWRKNGEKINPYSVASFWQEDQWHDLECNTVHRVGTMTDCQQHKCSELY